MNLSDMIGKRILGVVQMTAQECFEHYGSANTEVCGLAPVKILLEDNTSIIASGDGYHLPGKLLISNSIETVML